MTVALFYKTQKRKKETRFHFLHLQKKEAATELVFFFPYSTKDRVVPHLYAYERRKRFIFMIKVLVTSLFYHEMH